MQRFECAAETSAAGNREAAVTTFRPKLSSRKTLRELNPEQIAIAGVDRS